MFRRRLIYNQNGKNPVYPNGASAITESLASSIVLYDISQDIYIGVNCGIYTSDLFPLASYYPIGVISVQSSASDDGKASIVGLDTLSSGGQFKYTSVSSFSTGDTISFYPTIGNSSNSDPYTITGYTSSSSNFLIQSAKSETSYTRSNPYVVSPYESDFSTFNTKYRAYEEGNEYSNSLYRIDGDVMTYNESKLESSSDYALGSIYSYSQTYANSGLWYIPSLGELGMMSFKIDSINESLYKILEQTGVNCKSLEGGYSYWSSTIAQSSQCWSIKIDSSLISIQAVKSTFSSQFHVRPFIKLN